MKVAALALILGFGAANDGYAQEYPAKPGCANRHGGVALSRPMPRNYKWTLDRVITRVTQEERLLFSNSTV